MQVISSLPELSWILIIFIFVDSYSLPENTINISYPSLTLSVINNHLYFNHFILEENKLVHVSLNTYVVLRLHASEATFALHATFEVKLLICMSLNTLTYNLIQLIFLHLSLILFFDRLHIWDSLRLQIHLLSLERAILFCILHNLGRFVLFTLYHWFIDSISITSILVDVAHREKVWVLLIAQDLLSFKLFGLVIGI